jgi:3-deoxy-D-manno-octulosonic-acid transferase
MKFLYNFGILVVRFLSGLAAPFHPKARLFVQGRRGLLKQVKEDFSLNKQKVVWMHCASLGEFEQGRPIIDKIAAEFQNAKIVLTFFSPSGYEVRKNYPGAHHVYYLPWDTAENARNFIQFTKPCLAIFVKYEFWYNYSNELHRQGVPLISISSIFREDQLFFQPYATFYRSILSCFTRFFVQNESSVKLLRSIGLENATRSGDTRFDRVIQLARAGEEIPIAKSFKADQKTMVAGSCWPEDFEVLVPFINEQRMKFIVAPHEISDAAIKDFERSLQVKSVRYSQAEGLPLAEFDVLIIDNIGLLSRLYRYGEFAYIGGAFGKGLHNILEAACYGVPIFFGNRNYEKFQEALDLINRGGAFEITDYPDFKTKYEMLNVAENFQLACEVARQYVEDNVGATEKIMDYCRKVLS